MKLRKLFPTKLRTTFKRVLSTTLFGAVLVSGLANVTASGPVFNGPGNYPTLQVARANATSWGTSTGASIGETVKFMVWINNDINNTVAHSTTAKVTMPTGVSNSSTISAAISASNAATVTGTSVVNVGQPSRVGYITGTAQLFENNAQNQLSPVSWPNGVNPDTLVSTGVNLGDQIGSNDFSHARAIMFSAMVEGTVATINTNEAIQLNGGAPFNTSATAGPGDIVSFMVLLENTGNTTGTHPRIVNMLDNNLTYVPGSSYMQVKRNNQDYRVQLDDHLINFNGQTITWAFDNMAPRPDAALYLIFQAKVADSATSTVVKNHSSAQFDGVAKDTNEVTLTINRSAGVSFNLQKQVKNVTLHDNLWYDDRLASASAGDTVAYRLNLINTGSTTAQNVLLKDLLPAGLQFTGNASIRVGANPTVTPVSGDAIVNGGYTIDSIAPGNENGISFYFEAKLTGACTNDVVTNLGQVIYGAQLKAQDGAQIIYACTRGLIISKTALDKNDNTYKHDIGAVAQNEVITYRINVINNSTTTLVDPVLRDVLPQYASYVANSLSIDDEPLDQRSQQDFFNTGVILTTLTPGMSKTIKVQFKVAACAPQVVEVVNTAFAKAQNAAEVSDTAKAKIAACGTTPPPSTPPSTPPGSSTPPGTPSIPHTGPAGEAVGLIGLAGLGATTARFYLMKKKLQKSIKNIDIA